LALEGLLIVPGNIIGWTGLRGFFALIRVFAVRAKALLLDEPFSN